jgi:predicted metalloendopeptidase
MSHNVAYLEVEEPTLGDVTESPRFSSTYGRQGMGGPMPSLTQLNSAATAASSQSSNDQLPGPGAGAGPGTSSSSSASAAKHQRWTLIGLALLSLGLLIAVIVLAVQVNNHDHITSPPVQDPPAGASPIIDAATRETILTALNTSADPCNDFYEHVCGGWIDSVDLGQRNQVRLNFGVAGIVMQRATQSILNDDLPLMGLFQESCRDTHAINEAGFATLKPLFDTIQQASRLRHLYLALGKFQSIGLANNAWIRYAVVPGIFISEHSTYVMVAKPMGTTLPASVYYSDEGQTSLRHLMRLVFIELASDVSSTSVTGTVAALNARADAIVALESRIAALHQDNQATASVTTELSKSDFISQSGAPTEMTQYFAGLGMTSAQTNTVHANNFVLLSQIVTLLSQTPMATVQDYLRWHLILHVAHSLPEPLYVIAAALAQVGIPSLVHAYGPRDHVMEQLHPGKFYQPPAAQYARAGLKKQYVPSDQVMLERFIHVMRESHSTLALAVNTARADTCNKLTEENFVDYISHVVARRSWDESNYYIASDLVEKIRPQLAKRINQTEWMDEDTKQEALLKQSLIAANIAYGDEWLDYAGVEMANDAAQNYIEISAFHQSRFDSLLSKPMDRYDFPELANGESRHINGGRDYRVQNAFYFAQFNSINLPFGLLSSPMMSSDFPMMLNVARYGYVVGHEFGHAFDNSGRKYNGTGSEVNWWQPSALSQFNKRAQCLVDQYNSYEVVDGHNVDGAFTLGENVADMLGVNLAWQTYKENYEPSKTLPTAAAAGYTNDQLFFIFLGQSWCSKTDEQTAIRLLQSDEHSPDKWRINGALRNMPEFASTWNCPADSFMGNAANRCELW